MHVAFFEVKDWERTFLAERLPSDKAYFASGVLTAPAEELRGLQALSVFIYSHVTRDVLDALPELKIIATRSTGFDHIDVRRAAAAASRFPTCPRTERIPWPSTPSRSCSCCRGKCTSRSCRCAAAAWTWRS